MVEAATEEFSDIPIVLHQDHGGSPQDCKNCIDILEPSQRQSQR